MQYQLIASNFWNTRRISTVKLPIIHGDMWYESCLFVGSDNEVLDRYATLSEAILGHNRLAKQYGLKY